MSFSPNESRTTDNLAGALFLVTAISLLMMEAVLVRLVGSHASVSQAVFFRAAAQFIVIAGWVVQRGAFPSLKTDRRGLHLARGSLSVCAWWLYYFTFRNLGFALATVLSFTTSLFVVLLAGLVLGERVSRVSWIATLAGFVGVAIASGVGMDGMRSEALVGVLGGFCSSIVVFLNRSLTGTEDTLTIMTYIGFVALAVSTPMALAAWQPLTLFDGFLLMIAGIFGALGMQFTIGAYARGEPSTLAPIPYVRIVFALAAGYFVFSETPAPNTLFGAAIVIACALYATHAMRQKRRTVTEL